MGNRKMELGKEYLFAGYKWVPVEINEDCQVAIMQSLGVTAGPWPGFSMGKFGNGDYYNRDITGRNISDYDDKTRALMERIKPIVSSTGLYLPSYKNIKDNLIWKSTLARAANYGSSFGASYDHAWIGTVDGNNNAWHVYRDGNVYGNHQNFSFVVAPFFTLDLSKVEILGDEIVVKNGAISSKSSEISEKTDFQLLVELLDDFDPICSGVLSQDEVKRIQLYLEIEERNIRSLRNLRNFVVLFLADKADIERKGGNNEEFFRVMDIQSGIVSVIDQQIWKLKGQV